MGKRVPQHKCLVLEMRQDGRMRPLGKHEAHPAHFWWYTTYGGGHQMDSVSHPETDWDDTERRYCKRWVCLGRDAYNA